MISPLPQLGGTRADTLLRQRSDAIAALRAAMAALQETSPNGRDYPSGDGLDAAVRQHKQRVRAVQSVIDGLYGEMEAILGDT